MIKSSALRTFESLNFVCMWLYEWMGRGWRWVAWKGFLIDFHYKKVWKKAEYFEKSDWDLKCWNIARDVEELKVWMVFVGECMAQWWRAEYVWKCVNFDDSAHRVEWGKNVGKTGISGKCWMLSKFWMDAIMSWIFWIFWCLNDLNMLNGVEGVELQKSGRNNNNNNKNKENGGREEHMLWMLSAFTPIIIIIKIKKMAEVKHV